MNMLTNLVRLSVVIPFRNEKVIISNMVAGHLTLHSPEIEFIYVDDGSTDGSAEELRRLDFVSMILSLKGVGTGKAFLAGARNAKGQYIFLLPMDCVVGREVLEDLLSRLVPTQSRLLLFPKKYMYDGHMALYAMLQNFVLLRWLKLASWTNGFVFHRDLIETLEVSVKENFLNDLEFSRKLQRERWTILTNNISVSARRYEQDGTWQRIVLNGCIVLLWLLNWMSIQRLHQIYKRGKNV